MGGMGSRMRHFKIIDNDYIIAIGTGASNEEITEEEYTEILTAIHNKPAARDGYDYRLKTDLTWEEYEVTDPVPDEEDASPEDYQQALQQMGVNFNEEN